MKFSVILPFFFCLSVSIPAADLSSVKKAYAYLAKYWQYYTQQGKKVQVTALRYGCSAGNCYLLVNGSKKEPSTLYKLKGRQLVNIVSGKKGNTLSAKQAGKLDILPNVAKGKESGRMKGFTDAHNRYRKKAGVPNLVWSSKLSKYAKQWANYLRSQKSCSMQHRPRSGKYKQRYGENLAWASGQKLNPYQVTKMWYDEIKDYNYKNNSCSKVCGHYTQVVWKTSRRVGCAMARCGREELWVCNYDPPGNMQGYRPY
ncbi:MAG: CAP domain-containing protein [Spirochaetota bacterium]